MKTKFNIGDFIICPSAQQPRYIEIKDQLEDRYIMSYNKDGSIDGVVYFVNEDDWKLENTLEAAERKIKKEIGI